MAISHKLVNLIKRLSFKNGEPYRFKGRELRFCVGSRPVRRKYINSDNDIVRNDVLQIEYFEKYFNPDDVLWDIGSHHGHYSIFAGAIASGHNQVFSFEPDRAAREIQLQNIKLNGLDRNIKVFDYAISFCDKEVLFNTQGGNANSHIVKDPATINRGEVVSVMARSLNSLLNELPSPRFVKIDTEGAEIDILKGADKLLSNKDVRFICELHPFAWDRFDVSFGDFLKIIDKHRRSVVLLDSNKSAAQLPYYGTILF